MWLVITAMRPPITILVAVLSIALCSILALRRMPVDIFHPQVLSLHDLQYAQPLDYPTLQVNIDRNRAGQVSAPIRK